MIMKGTIPGFFKEDKGRRGEVLHWNDPWKEIAGGRLRKAQGEHASDLYHHPISRGDPESGWLGNSRQGQPTRKKENPSLGKQTNEYRQTARAKNRGAYS